MNATEQARQLAQQMRPPIVESPSSSGTRPTTSNPTPAVAGHASVRPPATLPLHCPQGHPVTAEARFCTTCGCEVKRSGLPQTKVDPPPATRLVVKSSNPPSCSSCHNGSHFAKPCCDDCQRLKPLTKDYQVHPGLFQWAQDAAAMEKLRSLKPLQSLAKNIAHRVGKPWIEATFNGVRVSSRQLPHVHRAAVNAGRILGLRRLPAVYVSGERPWDAATYGSEDQAFVVIGAALATSLQAPELQYILGREFGNILAGHAVWKTVVRFLVGEQQRQRGFFAGGVTGLLDPGKWIEGAVELPLLNWARQAEITADRAGLLVVPSLEIARRALLIWSLKSPLLYPQINLQEWLKQQDGDALDSDVQLAECVNSSTPYLARRLRLLTEYELSPSVGRFRQQVRRLSGGKRPEAKPPGATPADATLSDELQLACPACQRELRIPRSVLAKRKRLPVRCPHGECAKVHVLELPQAKSTHTILPGGLPAVSDE